MMFVVRKLNRELPFFFWLHRLIRVIRKAENIARIRAWSGAHMTNGANRRTRTDESLACEELLTMTVHASIVTGEIGHIGKISFGGPDSWKFMTGAACKALVLFR